VACGQSTTLNRLFLALREGLGHCVPGLADQSPSYLEGREGDIRHSLADLSSITARLGYQPTHSFAQGIIETLTWVTDPRRSG